MIMRDKCAGGKKDTFEMHAILVYCCKTIVKAPDKAINQSNARVLWMHALSVPRKL